MCGPVSSLGSKGSFQSVLIFLGLLYCGAGEASCHDGPSCSESGLNITLRRGTSIKVRATGQRASESISQSMGMAAHLRRPQWSPAADRLAPNGRFPLLVNPASFKSSSLTGLCPCHQLYCKVETGQGSKSNQAGSGRCHGDLAGRPAALRSQGSVGPLDVYHPDTTPLGRSKSTLCSRSTH